MLAGSATTVPPLDFFAGNRRDDAFDVSTRQRRPTARCIPHLQNFEDDERINIPAEEMTAL
jgi:hypothetical protein